MRLLTTAILTSTLVLGTAGIANAQLGGLKDLATDAAKGAVTDKASGALGGSALGGVTGGSSLGDLGGVAGKLPGGSLSGSESLTAGKVLLKGGSKTDALMAVGKERANGLVSGQTDGLKDKASGIVNKQVGKYGSGTAAPTTSYGSGTPAAAAPAPAYGSGTPAATESYGSGSSSTATSTPSAPTVSCPSGTKAQADGTCMVTGNWGG